MKTNQNQTQPDKYKMTLIVGGKEYKGLGETVLMAIKDIKIPEFIKGKIVLRAEKDKLSTQKVMNFVQLRRLKNNPIYQVILSKQLGIYLK